MNNIQVGVKLIPIYQGKILTLKRNPAVYTKVQVTLWDIPGGRIDPEATLEANLSRELKEEVGLKLEVTEQHPLRLLGAQDIFVTEKSLHVVRLTYVARVTGTIALSSEHTEHQLVGLHEPCETFGPDTLAGSILRANTKTVTHYLE